MEWGYVVIIVLFIVGVVLAFPLAIGICAALGGLLIGLDRFTARCPGFSHLRRWHQRRLYHPGQIVSQFLAPDVRRDVEVVDASGLDAGLIAVRTRHLERPVRDQRAFAGAAVRGGGDGCN